MKKKISLVFGGSRGIGKVIATTLKQRGDKVFVLSRKASRSSNNININLSDEKDISYKIKRFLNKIKINNIIFSQRYRGENWKDDYQVSLHSVGLIINLLKKKLVKNSSVVIISSVSTRTILDDQSQSYHLIRSALEQLVKFFAVRLGKKNIRFNCVMPTKIIKPENKNFYNKKGKSIKDMMKIITPLNRMGTATDVANLVEFLTSEKSVFLTGLSIPVDGGTSLLSQESIINILKNNKSLLRSL